jgi:beta-N-acetylhexosaminidase
MSRELERLALRVLMPGFEGREAPDWLLRLAADLGSVCLYSRNVGQPEQVAALTARLHDAGPQLLVAIDEEGGDVTRLEAEAGSSFPGNLALGSADDPALTEAVAAAMGAWLGGLGVDLDLAPVADVNSNPANPVIGVRSFGADPARVAVHTAAFVRGLQGQGVAACAKHFPGHGDTHVDSHLDLPQVEAPELEPFRAAIAAGVAAVMSAHISVRSLGALPATLNPAAVRLLREELGFTGLLVSDGIEMRALTSRMTLAEAAVAALNAGVDLVCVGGGHAGEETVAELQTAVVAGVDEARLREAAGRVEEVARRRMVRQEPAAVDAGVGLAAARRALRVVGDVRLAPDALIVELEGGRSIAAGAHRPRLVESSVHLTEGEADLPALLARAAGRDLAIAVRDPHRLAWQRALLDGLLAARPDAVVVDLGFPVLEPPARGLLRTFGAARANRLAALEMLFAGVGAVP